jgi:uncharacterized membrane protein YfcA
MEELLLFAAVGFLAQMVDGALGMGYGVVCSSVLLAFGVPPATVSAVVHASKVFTGAASAASHAGHKNVDWRMLWPLAIGGGIGGVLGTFVLTSVDGDAVKPYVIGWLFLMGLLILWRAWKARPIRPTPFKSPGPLGLVGGFLDALGGGGWGPTVTTTLVGVGAEPRLAIGTSNTAEFLVATVISSAFVFAILTGHWTDTGGMGDYAWAAAGLVGGGILAAPLAGWLTKVLPTRGLTWVVGALVLVLAGWQGVAMLT